MLDVVTSALLRAAGFAHGFSLRGGGLSEGAFASLNLDVHVGDDPARVQSELSLQVSLGAAFMAVKGYGAREVGRAYARARELSRRLADPRQHVRVIWGLWSFYYVRGEHQTAHELAEQCLSLAQQLEDPVRLMQAHQAVGTSLVAQPPIPRC